MDWHNAQVIQGNLEQFTKYPSKLRIWLPYLHKEGDLPGPGEWIYRVITTINGLKLTIAIDSLKEYDEVFRSSHFVGEMPWIGPHPDELTLKSEPTAHTTRPDVTKWPPMSRSSRSGGGSRSR